MHSLGVVSKGKWVWFFHDHCNKGVLIDGGGKIQSMVWEPKQFKIIAINLCQMVEKQLLIFYNY